MGSISSSSTIFASGRVSAATGVKENPSNKQNNDEKAIMKHENLIRQVLSIGLSHSKDYKDIISRNLANYSRPYQALPDSFKDQAPSADFVSITTTQ